MRISDGSSDVGSSDLPVAKPWGGGPLAESERWRGSDLTPWPLRQPYGLPPPHGFATGRINGWFRSNADVLRTSTQQGFERVPFAVDGAAAGVDRGTDPGGVEFERFGDFLFGLDDAERREAVRSDEQTSE